MTAATKLFCQMLTTTDHSHLLYSKYLVTQMPFVCICRLLTPMTVEIEIRTFVIASNNT